MGCESRVKRSGSGPREVIDGMRRFFVLFLAFCVLLAPLSPALEAARAGERSESTEFLDKWILNGGSIGSAAGATIGQWLGTVMAPGPVGWVVGSLIGGFIGGIVGTLIDNQIGGAYNYTAFDRPPLEDGGLILEGVGPWEQGFYQVDQWVIQGGNIMSLVGHFGVNIIGAMIPGPMGRFLSSYLGIFLFDAIFGTIGDNLDGLIDGGRVGREIDRARGTLEGPELESRARTDHSPAAPGTSDEAYRSVVDAASRGASALDEARRALERYRGSEAPAAP